MRVEQYGDRIVIVAQQDRDPPRAPEAGRTTLHIVAHAEGRERTDDDAREVDQLHILSSQFLSVHIRIEAAR